ncbi:MAG: hypothetical protein U0354_19070 [Candidatus Sericytochromatia bacterium]
MASINFNNLLSTVTTDNVIRKTVSLNPNNFSQSILQISDQQSRDKSYEKSLEYIRTYIASLQAKINSLVEELNVIYENMLTETLFRRADSKNTAKKVNKLVNATASTADGTSSSLKDANAADPDPDKTGIVPTGYEGETRLFQYNPFFGTRAADLSNYYNQTGNSTVSTARAYYQTTDNQHHEFGASALGALGYLWQWDVDRINASYATTMDKFIDSSGMLHISPYDPINLVDPNNPTTSALKQQSGTFMNGGAIYIDPALAIVGRNNSEKLQVNITALQPNRGLADISGPDAPKKIIPITNLNTWPGFQPGNITYTNGSGYKFTPPVGNQLFFDTEKWAVVDANGVEPTMEVLTRVTRESPPVDSFGPNYSGVVPYGGLYGTSAAVGGSGWINLTRDDGNNPRAVFGHAPGLWDAGGPTGRNGVHQVDLEKEVTFADTLLAYPTEPPVQTASSGGGDDGWALYVRSGGGINSIPTGIGPWSNPYSPNSPWTLLRAVAGPAGINYTGTTTASQTMTLHVAGNTSGWAGGSDGGAYINGNFSIAARTFREDTATQKRYVVDESGSIIDRFGLTGWNGNYGHFGGSVQLSNPNHALTNKYGSGYDDYNLYDYVPDPTSAGPSSSVGTIPDVGAGDYFYYRENLNQGDTINLNGPNISFDPRATNMSGMISVSNNRVEIKNTDFAMFGNTFLTYVEQNQDIYNQSKTNSFATWIGESDKDYVANNDTTPNGEKDYKMSLNFENKDENGVGILSSVRRVHVNITGQPTIQDPETDDWDSKTWNKRTILDQQINPWSPDTSTGGIVNTDGQSGDSAIPLSISGSSASFDVQSLSTLVTPGYWTPDGATSVYVNMPWNNAQVFTPSLDVQPDRLSGISGEFVIDPSSTTNTAGDLKVAIQYSNDGVTWTDIPGAEQCTHNPCSGNHGWNSFSDHPGTVISDGLSFNLPAPPAQDGVTKIRVFGTVNGVQRDPIFGTLTLQADKERYVDPVYADKIVTKDIIGTGANLSTYRNARIVLNNNVQTPVAGAQVERVIQFRNNGGAWTDLIANPPQGAITVDLPASANGNVDVRAVVRVKAFASPSSTPAVNDIWNISDMRIVGEPIPDEPKTLGLEMTKGFYNGVEQTGGGIINPISSTEATYAPTYASQQSGVQNFYTDINGVAGFNMYLNKDEYEIARKKNPVVNDSTIQVTVDYVEDTNQDGRIDNTEASNVKTKILGVNEATRNAMSGNRRIADLDSNQAFNVYNNILTVGKGRTGGADEKTGNENKLTKRLKQVLDSQEWQEVLKYGLLDNIYIAATANDNRGDQITGKLLLDWDWRRRRIDLNQLFFSSIYKA